MNTKSNSLISLKSVELIFATVCAGLFPYAIFAISHTEKQMAPVQWYFLCLIMLGASYFSFTSVCSWARTWTKDAPKAVCFTLLLEGLLIASPDKGLAYVCLCLLAGINCIAAIIAVNSRVRAFATPAKRPAKVKTAKAPAKVKAAK